MMILYDRSTSLYIYDVKDLKNVVGGRSIKKE